MSTARCWSTAIRGLAAVTADSTVPYSSGAIENHANRITMIKRQMYGRPNQTCCASASCSPTDPHPQSTTATHRL